MDTASTFNTPILLLIFNRPDTTKQVMQVIRQVKPRHLYIAADGPRTGNERDRMKCEEAIKLTMKAIDWDCDVKTLFRSENEGCRNAVSSAISWFFGQVEEGIILEDDTLPDISFFSYCTNMLERYRNEHQVVHIAGTNFQRGQVRGKADYYFSKYSHIWGWATWKRAWKHYDLSMSKWPEFKQSDQFHQWCFDRKEKDFWTSKFDSTFSNEIDTWDYQWLFAVITNNGYCLMPNCNLISNIGFGSDATHTQNLDSEFARQKVSSYVFPDKISPLVLNKKADMYTFNTVFNEEEKMRHPLILAKGKIGHYIKGMKRKVKRGLNP